MTPQTLARCAALTGALAVVAGALGSHGLAERLALNGHVATWDTAVRYHLAHAVALLALAGLAARGKRATFAATGMLLGTAIFSGTLYAIALGGPSWLGMITPVGGVLLVCGWLATALPR